MKEAIKRRPRKRNRVLISANDANSMVSYLVQSPHNMTIKEIAEKVGACPPLVNTWWQQTKPSETYNGISLSRHAIKLKELYNKRFDLVATGSGKKQSAPHVNGFASYPRGSISLQDAVLILASRGEDVTKDDFIRFGGAFHGITQALGITEEVFGLQVTPAEEVPQIAETAIAR